VKKSVEIRALSKMADKWVGKIAVITGASSGIGAAIFTDFVRRGINVIGLARRLDRVEALIKELGKTCGKAYKCAYAYKCDISDPKSVTEAFKWIEMEFGVVNILVNNAGIGRTVAIFDENEESFRKMNEVIDTNLRGLTQCTREAYRLMKKSDDYGLIININSILGRFIPFMGITWNMYPPSKYAVTALTECIRQELVIADNKKVRVTSLSPGGVATEIRDAAGAPPRSVKEQQQYEERTLKPEDVSHSVMFLLSTPYTVNITELTIRPVGEKA